MRCPKCGYITFDHLETCPKCRKNIATAAAELSGTTLQAEAPAFLQFEVHAEAAAGIDEPAEVFSDGSDIEMDVDIEEAGDDIEFAFEEEEATADAAGFEEDDFDLPLTDDEPDLDIESSAADSENENSGPQLDFSELDISDLAPPAEDELPDDELTLEEAVPAAGLSASPAPGVSEGGLEDLQMEGLDLGVSSAAAAGEAIKPAVKTGTALDDFDIDLGELTSGQDK